ncbi:hypothetical protein OE749_03225 [Aestuariibacter sp. AA17]|uniref:Secreted protein n=1 Tax=Fluctibacter corallii TaxID=2984329 RepID=A0ABT3A4U2_9ALTE|nr:hypothetical protein [Aestuariibacter sp. AA17]MCV2883713.1 hypothetical protein [Aestuariibacter sp. AA17]
MKLSINPLFASALIIAASTTTTVNAANPQDAFFEKLKTLCNKSFAGEVTVDSSKSSSFANKPLKMHVRTCEENKIEIPFYVGSNASRTWIITKSAKGLTLKHDHRHRDGSEDTLTQYGGHTIDEGWAQVQSFPADDFSKSLFVENGIPDSIDNTWQLYIYPDKFTYRLKREGREFSAVFDLTKTIDTPPAPWSDRK